MKNREQIRAANALKALRDNPELRKGQQGGDALTGFPALVVSNGLLATTAYSKAKGSGYPMICDAISRHLADTRIGLLPPKVANATGMVEALTNEQSDSESLRLCTAEALAYLNFLRRFAKSE